MKNHYLTSNFIQLYPLVFQYLPFDCYEYNDDIFRVHIKYINIYTHTHICIYVDRLILFSSFIGEFKNTDVPYMYAIEVEESTSVECGITFSPIEVSSVFCYGVEYK